jgi:hypothetical protein
MMGRGGGGGGVVVVVLGGGVGAVVVGGGGVVVAAGVAVSGAGSVTGGEVVVPTLDAAETPLPLSALEPRVVVAVGGDVAGAVGTRAGLASSVRPGVSERGDGPDVCDGVDVGDGLGRGRWGSEVAPPRSV